MVAILESIFTKINSKITKQVWLSTPLLVKSCEVLRTWTPFFTERWEHAEQMKQVETNCFFAEFLTWHVTCCRLCRGFPGGSDGKASVHNAGDPGSIPGSGRSPGEGNGNPLQHSCLENPMDGGAWWATVHGVAKRRTWPSGFTSFHFVGFSSLPQCTSRPADLSHPGSLIA